MTTVLKFYASKPNEGQKLFAFKVYDLDAARKLLLTFEQNGSKIKAIWICMNDDRRCIYNWRMNMNTYKLFRGLVPYLNKNNMNRVKNT